MEVEVKILEDIMLDLAGITFYEGAGEIVTSSDDQKDLVYHTICSRIVQVASPLCPFKNGRLRDSVKIVRNAKGTWSVVYPLSYAQFVHEIMDNMHQPPTRAKWLEDSGYEVLSEFGGNKPLFTFEMKVSWDGVELSLDTIDSDRFMYLTQRKWRRLHPTMDDLGDLDEDEKWYIPRPRTDVKIYK